jgi:hypothetical protein
MAARDTETDPPDPSDSMIFNRAKGGLFSGPFDSTGLDANVRSLLLDYRWTTTFNGSQPATTISYFFPQQASDYTDIEGYSPPKGFEPFRPATAQQEAATRMAFDLVESYTKLKFVKADSGSAADAAIRVARYAATGSEAGFPANDGSYWKNDSRDAGDAFLGGNGTPPDAFFGTDHFNTIMHELGHAFGLKHGHDPKYNGMLAANRNDNEFSVMTYASYFAPVTGGATEARLGSSPQSYMMYDIAALQALYGPNFDKVGQTVVYTWDPTTGQQLIDNQPAPFTGVTATGKIFSTIWTQGAKATYDFSNFSENQTIKLGPGEWSTFSKARLADLNKEVDAGTPGNIAQGNIYNALLFNGDERSLVHGSKSGSGNDTITGNAADTTLDGGAGSDNIDGGGGHDTVSGVPGADTINMARGKVTLRDTPADMDDDILTGADSSDALDFAGVLATEGNISVARTAATATISIGGASIDMSGDFTDGAFMIDGRGAGADAHTTVTFVSFLPTLSEGSRVIADAINGVANEAFLTGDGSDSFVLNLRSATSAFSNTLGSYRVDANGNISDVHVIFANTLDPGTSTYNLGTPGMGVEIGFFLIQDGFNRFGNLPDNLSFVTEAGQAANTEAGLPIFLQSATAGLLNGAVIFHSSAALNPGGADQVLSGVAPGGRELMIGFEDLGRASSGAGSDEDFEDVVVGIQLTNNDSFIL